ncbi:MAG: N-6 DNA methylase [Acidimicrobiia bacterium]|nr:N-6 DNA methylase [Acidimicrobiia bacterium]
MLDSAMFETDATLFDPDTTKIPVDNGEVFTRRWMVEFILDLVGYTSDRDLGSLVIVEPSCGAGAFLDVIVDRLIESVQDRELDIGGLDLAIRAYDLLEENVALSRKTIMARLEDTGLSPEAAERLAAHWVVQADFLIDSPTVGSADLVVGNPPYVRLENVPTDRMVAYRTKCRTMRGRSDLYVGFIETGLSLLRPGGVLGFICADRWMRNQYGADLRELITGSYCMDTVVTMHDVNAFEHTVSAYPAVVVVRNEPQGTATVIDAGATFGESSAQEAISWKRTSSQPSIDGDSYRGSRLSGWFEGRNLWPGGSPQTMALLTDLETRFPPLEDPETGTRVGIGVATGCDEVYITDQPDIVEADRLLPLLQARDTTSGVVEWSGRHLINPWDEDGLVDLDGYPRLRSYFAENAGKLGRRHIARKRPQTWYRTIDRVHPGLTRTPKLVIPDLKASANPVLDDGRFYPHHNLYYVVSEGWDLEVLGGLLLSKVANLFVGAYCVKMRGGCYRFQAQYLRKIRVPNFRAIDPGIARSLAEAFRERDVDGATELASKAYGIDDLAWL